MSAVDRDAALDTLYAIGRAAAAALCSHVDGGSCPRCSASIGVRLAAAVEAVAAPDRPAPDPPAAELYGASRS